MGGGTVVVMSTFLLKTEPSDYSIDDLKADGSTMWDGVSNNAALKHMRSVKKGDEALLYHTGKEREIVGLAQITSAPYPNPELDDERMVVFDVRYRKRVKTPVALSQIKADKRFAGFALVREPRLSVMPVPVKLDGIIRKMAGL